MAEIDSKAFDYMNEGDPDYVAGGALAFSSKYQTKATSKFDTEMTPDEQESFLKENAQIFKNLYDTDPNVDRKKLSYKSYLENVDPKLLSMRAEEYDMKMDSDDPNPEISPDVLNSKKIWEHADKHYGDISKLRDMALGKGYKLY
jgi:hypothetical protein